MKGMTIETWIYFVAFVILGSAFVFMYMNAWAASGDTEGRFEGMVYVFLVPACFQPMRRACNFIGNLLRMKGSRKLKGSIAEMLVGTVIMLLVTLAALYVTSGFSFKFLGFIFPD
jgi:hypothetical protein